MTASGEDTIAAISTAPGRAGVALIRVSGPGARAIAGTLGIGDLTPRRSRLSVVRGVDGERLDRALTTWFEPPASFTGEPVLEISCHGGALVPALILDAICAAGARVAEPGEFTRRAFLNGKLDLVQAEATLDLVDATSRAHHRAAVAQLSGGLSARVEELRLALLDLQAAIAYDIDFPEEDDGPLPRERIEGLAAEVEAGLAGLLLHAPEGERLRTGALAVIAGAPNAGKSTVFNELIGTGRALVTEVPGTTRDAIEADISIGGYPFRLVDTAGVRTGAEPIEEMGIEVARSYLERAELVLLCVEADRGPSEAERELAAGAVAGGAVVLVLRTKTDRVPGPPVEAEWRGPSERPPIGLSSPRGEGLPELREALVDAVFRGLRTAGQPALVTRGRQARALARARDDAAAFRRAIAAGHPMEIAATHAQDAVVALEELLGVTDHEEVLDRLFASFCVGK